jgi:hypothetical protein
MIPVIPQPEPEDFDARVRQPGLASLAKKQIALEQALPPKTDIEPYWRGCLDDLYLAYDRTCAYLAVFFERATGGGTVDHYIAKSGRAGLAYEWGNYRLASSIMNSRKRDYDDVLDPFTIQPGWFHLELASGRIFPAPNLPPALQQKIAATIERLDLDDGNNREMRARHFQEFRQGLYLAGYLAQRSPLVYAEVQRQDQISQHRNSPASGFNGQ